ncbi:MAG TPA: DUF3566 domain-containing protein [Mycobacterium sp.]|nr:DUF3566 domain-containing protein [Mycobacterium sp.]
MTETQATSGAAGTSMDRAERDEAAEKAAADHAAVGRATVPAEKGKPAGDGPDAKDNGRGDRPPVTASARVGGGASGRAGVLTSPAPAAPGAPGSTNQGAPQAAPNPSGSSGSPGSGTAAPTSIRPGVAPNRPLRPAGLATVGGSAAPVNGAPAMSPGRVAEAVRSARTTVSAAAARGPRRARLFVKRVDPWSVMKFSFAVSFVMFFVLIVATAVLYLALDQMDVFSHVNSALATITSNSKDIKVTAPVIIGGAGGIGLVGVVLFTALSTLGAFVYNVCADLVGGVEVTLSEKE